MPEASTPVLPLVDEENATADVTPLFEEAKRVMQTPFTPNMMKGLAVWPDGAALFLEVLKTLFERTTLPLSLVSMICYAIATRNNCVYCSSIYETHLPDPGHRRGDPSRSHRATVQRILLSGLPPSSSSRSRLPGPRRA